MSTIRARINPNAIESDELAFASELPTTATYQVAERGDFASEVAPKATAANPDDPSTWLSGICPFFIGPAGAFSCKRCDGSWRAHNG
jgi:hypothetical protein